MAVLLKNRIKCMIFFSLFFTKLIAQESECDCNFKNLKDLYLVGQFSSAISNINCCINSPKLLTLNEMNRMKELLTLIAIAQDSLDKANTYLNEIIISNPNYEPETQNIVFLDLFYKARKENLKVTVSSVSKRPEDIETAPAVVEIIEAKDILARGYVDLIDLLSDIPGFEISKTHAINYANVYQLGYRQQNTERTLFMIDGVEENDLYSNIAYISRQYPISNIKAVEILYGPSATMYGPRAFMGTINVITYSPREEAGNYFENEKLDKGSPFYFHSNVARGSYDTYDVDFTLGNSLKNKQIYFQLTGRYFQSQEHDMSDESFFNYDISDLNNFEYDHLNKSFVDVDQYLSENNLPYESRFYTIDEYRITLTDYGRNMAAEYDRLAYLSQVNGDILRYSNHTENFYIGGKIAINNLTMGFRSWTRAEGMNHMQDLDIASSRNGSMWIPKNLTTYLKFNHSFNDRFSFSAQTSIKQHHLDRRTNRVNFIPFGNPNYVMQDVINLNLDGTSKDDLLDIVDLVNYNSDPLDENQTKHGWRNQYYHYQALQGRTEARFFYNSENLNLTFGIDRRITTSQGDYIYYNDFNTKVSKEEYRELSNMGLAEEYGERPIIFSDQSLNNNYKINDFGSFVQGNLVIGENLHINAGLRYDKQVIRDNQGYEVFEPRFGIVLTSNFLTFKSNYSKGFQNVSLYNRYSTGGNRIPNPLLKPEQIQYLDVSLLGNLLNEKLKWNFTGFAYDVKDAINEGIAPYDGYNLLDNEGDYITFGGMANIKYRAKKFRFDLNGTFLDPLEGTISNVADLLQSELSGEDLPDGEKRVGDIAKFRFNIGVTKFFENEVFESSINLRANYVGEKKVGPETTQEFNLGLNESELFPEYLVLNSNLIFGFKRLANAKFAVSINNIFNNLYYHPGIRSASAAFDLYQRNPEEETYESWANRTLTGKFVPYAPQRRRNFNFKLILDL